MSGEAYEQRYVDGFADTPDTTTAIDSEFLNAVEAALLRLLGADPTDSGAQVWDAVLGRFKTALLTNENIDASAAIDKGKLAALQIADADIAAGAAIDGSKLAADIPASKIADYPGDSTEALFGDGSWKAVGDKTSASQQRFLGEVRAPDFYADLTGLQGRFVGCTTSGPPVSGSFQAGDFVSTRDGQLWVCTSAGSPGTWTHVFKSVSPSDGVGYATGAGGTATESGGAVTLNKVTGQITVSSHALGSLGNSYTFTVTNSTVGPTDVVVANHSSPNLSCIVNSGSGSFTVTLVNATGVSVFSGGTLSFAVLKAVTS